LDAAVLSAANARRPTHPHVQIARVVIVSLIPYYYVSAKRVTKTIVFANNVKHVMMFDVSIAPSTIVWYAKRRLL
jgi:hypothetical protein